MTDEKQVTQAFLDSSQYQEDHILEYEQVYGEDFVSPGGKEFAREMITRLELEPGTKVLDVGCGLGGSAFVMAGEFGIEVDGIDLSKNMLALARRKLEANGLSDAVCLIWGDCLELDCADSYDAIFSRDVFLHIADKARLFAVLNTALRPGGKLLFTDYCCSPQPWGAEFQVYVEDRGYTLHTVEEYAGLISGAGFERVVGEDITDRFIEILHADIARIEQLGMDQAGPGNLEQSWHQKLARSETGDHRWGLFSACKAVA